MTLHFYIKFQSRPGESVHVIITCPFKNNTETHIQLPLNYLNKDYWYGNIQLQKIKSFRYTCNVQTEGSETTNELMHNSINLKRTAKEIEIWADGSKAEFYEAIFKTKPFTQVFNKKKKKEKAKGIKIKKNTHIFNIQTPFLSPGKLVCITGSSKLMNEWDAEKPLLLRQRKKYWNIELDLSKETFPLDYKFGIFDIHQLKIIEYEPGSNRILENITPKKSLSILQSTVLFTDQRWKGAGVNIPISSLKTNHSWGIGDLSDLNSLVDWAEITGLRLIQLLPINDTSATHTIKDSYPYSTISAFALHPLYLNVEKLAKTFDVNIPNNIKQQVVILNDLPKLDYESVSKVKLSAIKLIFEKEKTRFKDDFGYIEFFELNSHWLSPYAAFCYLRDKYNTADYNNWEIYKIYDPEAIQQLVSTDTTHYDELAIHYFIQYHLHLQLSEATEYAHKKGIIIKGDLPIGMGRHSVDTWMYPSLFNLETETGAPPDAFSEQGQNWGFPTYNWPKMEADDYCWWRNRMEHLGNYFDAIRIDHVLGFFRIWSISKQLPTSILGKFDPAIPLTKSDFENAGIVFDEGRFCKPFSINDKSDVLMIKNDFTTQAPRNEHKNPRRKKIQNKSAKSTNGSQISSAGALEATFNFRINMQQTTSFKNLSIDQQTKLNRLYNSFFYENQNALWKQNGTKKLKALKNTTDMLLCAEDLGMAPTFIPQALDELEILSLQVERMPKNSNEIIFEPKNAPYLSVVTPSTHDMSTIREWWEENRETTQYFYNHILEHYGEAPYFCEPWICKEIIEQHLNSHAMWRIFLLQDLLSIDEKLRRINPRDERINIPANAEHSWNYRMHKNLEGLINEKVFNDELKQLITESGN